MNDDLIKAAYKASREEGKPISKECAEFICEDYFALQIDRDKFHDQWFSEVKRFQKLEAKLKAAEGAMQIYAEPGFWEFGNAKPEGGCIARAALEEIRKL